MKYINPLTDFGFKRLFGSEPHKDLLIDFLNSIFQGRKEIIDLDYHPQEHKGETEEEGVAIFDVLCSGPKGERFIIEVQMGAAPNFVKRSLFYVSRLISGMAPHGKRKSWSYNISEVYFVALIESAPMNIAGEESDYLHRVSFCSEKSKQVFYDGLSLVYIELRNFVKVEEQLASDLDKWFYILKHLSDMDRLPLVLRKPVFERVFRIAEYSGLSKEDKNMYDTSLKRKWDSAWLLNNAKEEGRMEGRADERADLAKKMLSEGFSLDVIERLTGLSKEEIASL